MPSGLWRGGRWLAVGRLGSDRVAVRLLGGGAVLWRLQRILRRHAECACYGDFCTILLLRRRRDS